MLSAFDQSERDLIEVIVSTLPLAYRREARRRLAHAMAWSDRSVECDVYRGLMLAQRIVAAA